MAELGLLEKQYKVLLKRPGIYPQWVFTFPSSTVKVHFFSILESCAEFYDFTFYSSPGRLILKRVTLVSRFKQFRLMLRTKLFGTIF